VRRRVARALIVVLATCTIGSVPGPPAGAASQPARHLLGRSVRGRPIEALELRAPHPRATALVVGCIHGDERAGIAVARRVAAGPVLSGTDLWVVPNLNPDGAAADTRQNAHGVDLNRNFPWAWRPLGRRGDQQYSGPRALSEPESRMARRLILRVRPKVTIWFHQPVGVTDESGGDLDVERRFAALSGLPLRRLTRYPGSASSWQNGRFPGTTAFVVEWPPGRASRAATTRYVRAVRAVAQG
jgi:protein MpaA